MKKFILLLFLATGLVAQTNCELCVESGGFYCGDDESNWTQYSPNGCVQASWLNDGWDDCVDAGDENGASPTTLSYCNKNWPYISDTVYVEVFVTDTLYIYETFEIETFIDCDTGIPCNVSIEELLHKAKNSERLFNLLGEEIREKKGIYIENGKIMYKPRVR